MTKSPTPTLVSIILIGLTLLVIAILPVHIEIRTGSVQAQETPTGDTSLQPVSVEAKRVEYTLKTVLGQTPPMAYIGVGGAIDGVINPVLTADVGDTVKITLINGDPVLHSLAIAEFGVGTGQLTTVDQTASFEFMPDRPGDFAYFCDVPGHKEVGMNGILRVSGTALPQANAPAQPQVVAAVPTAAPAAVDAVSVVRNPADLPPPVGDRGPMNIRIDLTTQEVTGILADGTTFDYFTFGGKIPGPMIRVRQGDTIELHLTNDPADVFPHSIDLHAVTGPGGGAVYTQTVPGGETMFTFQALNVGVYVYHCATASIPHHISEGMYGLIVVEPPGGLPKVDREFYVMQGDIYTLQPFGTAGHLSFDMEAMHHEDPTYVVFNGAVGGLTSDENALRANLGETVRIFFGVGGPNLTSSFHVIGEIFDRVYVEGSLTAPPLTDVQTTMVPTGGAAVVEFKVNVPGRYILVDHSLARLEKGLAGYLYVEGDPQPDIFYGEMTSASSGH